MYLIIAGGGKVGTNLTRSLLRGGHEVTLIEQRPYRFDKLETEFEHQVIRGDATEMFVLERAGIKRPPDLLIASTGDDEDNIIICQLAREKYGVNNVIARINDPRNQPYFDLLGISPTVSATGAIMGLIEHEGAGGTGDAGRQHALDEVDPVRHLRRQRGDDRDAAGQGGEPGKEDGRRWAAHATTVAPRIRRRLTLRGDQSLRSTRRSSSSLPGSRIAKT